MWSDQSLPDYCLRLSALSGTGNKICVQACVYVYTNDRNTPDYLFRKTAVDGINVLLQSGAGLSLDLLHFLQPSTGHKQTASLAVMRQHLGGKGRYECIAQI